MANKKNLGRRALALFMALVLSMSLLQMTVLADTIAAEDTSAPVVTAGDTASSTGDPVTPTEDPVTPTEYPVTPTEDPVTPTEDPASSTETPATPTEDPASSAETPATPTEDPASSTETPATPTEDPASSTETPASSTETPAPVEEPSVEITGSDSCKGVTVNVDAPEGAFPAGTTLTITPISGIINNFLWIPQSNVEDAVQDAMDDPDSLCGLAAFDITFYDVNSHEIQPADGYTVAVTFSVDQDSQILSDDANTLQAFHVDENDEAQAVSDPTAIDTDAESNEVSVEASSFSIYAVATLGSPTDAQPLGSVLYMTAGQTQNVYSDVSTAGAGYKRFQWISSDNSAVSVVIAANASYATLTAKKVSSSVQITFQGNTHNSGHDNQWITLDSATFSVALPTVPTLSAADTSGITMKMLDFNPSQISSGHAWTNALAGNWTNGQLAQGMMSTTLGTDGYPISLTGSNATGSGNHSLKNVIGDLIGGTSVNNLFLSSVYNADATKGTYYYNSAENYAKLNSTGDFTVYKALGTPQDSSDALYTCGNFLPYNTIGNQLSSHDNRNTSASASNPTDAYTGTKLYLPDGGASATDFYFGMYMNANFAQLGNGQYNGRDMAFNFSGDDDMWVYIDGVLVLDLGGIHIAQDGSINFATGAVTWTNRSSYSEGQPGSATIKEQFINAGKYNANDFKGDTFADYTNHSIVMFYMERGAGASDLKLSFNLPTIPQNSVTVNKMFDLGSGTTTSAPTGFAADATFTLYNAGGTEVAHAAYSQFNDGSYTFSGLTPGSYTVVETGGNGDVSGYQYTNTTVGANTTTTANATVTATGGDSVTFVNHYVPATASFTVDKVWNGNENSNQPDTVTVALYNGMNPYMVDGNPVTGTLNAAGNWEYTFTNLPAGGDYNAVEQNPAAGYTVRYIPAGQMNVTSSEWVRTKNTLTFDNGINHGFIIVKDGSDYLIWTQNAITSDAVKHAVYDAIVAGADLAGPFKANLTYGKCTFISSNDDETYGLTVVNNDLSFETKNTWAQFTYGTLETTENFTVVNTYTTPVYDLTVGKTVSYDNSKSQQPNPDDTFAFTVTFNGSIADPTSVSQDTAFTTDSNYTFSLKGGQSLKITGVPSGTTYSVAETAPTNTHYTCTPPDNASGTVTAATPVNFTNNYFNSLTTSVHGEKSWQNGGTPPASITVSLYKNSGTTADSQIVTPDETTGKWTYDFDNLPLYDSPTSAQNVYTVAETAIAGTTSENGRFMVYGTSTVPNTDEKNVLGCWTFTVNGYDITNTWTPAENFGNGSFSVQKCDAGTTPLAGATFTLSAASENGPTGFATITQTTGTDGDITNDVLTFRELPVGNYVLQETSAPSGYSVAGPWNITVTDEGKVLVSVTNPTTGNVFTNVWHWIVGLAGGDSLGTSGTLTVNDTPINYSLTIAKTVSGISGSGSYQFNVYKMGEDSNYPTTPANESPISVTAGNSTTLTTENYSWLTAGSYKVEEVNANVSSDNSYHLSTTYSVNSSSGNVVTLTDAASSGTVTCTNAYSLKTGDLTITKNVTGTTTTDSFAITVTIGGTPYSGSYSVGSTSCSATSGVISLSSGQTATISGLPYGTSYSVAETGANASSYNVSYTVNGAAGSSGTIGATNSVIVTNAYVTSGFLIYKENSGNTLLSGSEFTLYTAYSAGTETPYDNGANGVYADSDSDGRIAVSNLPAGEYWLKETKAPVDYELSSTVWHITVTSGTNAAVTVEPATEVGANTSIIAKLLNAVITFVTGKDDENYNVTADNGNVVLTVVDAPIDYSLTIEKAISGVSGTTGTYYFDIYGQDQNSEYTNLLQEDVAVAVDNGVCTPVTLHTLGTNGCSWLKAGSYKIVEDTAASSEVGNYSLAGTAYQTGATAASLTSADIVTLSDSATDAYAKVTNTYARDTGTLEITKVVRGLQGTAASQDHTFTFTVANSENTATYTVTVNGNGNNSNSSISLPTGTYTVTESDVSLQYHNGPTVGYSVGGQETQQVTIAKGTPSTITVTNAYDYDLDTTKQSITVNKVWEDDSNRDGIRPNSVTVELWDSSETSRKIDTKVIQTASTGNTASSTFTFDPYVNGYVGPYHVVETGYTLSDNTFVPITSDTPYTASYLSTADNELMTDGTVVGNAITITNTHQPEEIYRIPVVKTWSGSVGSSIELALYKGDDEDTGLRLNMTADTGGTSDTQFVSADGHTWIGTFSSYSHIQPTLARLSIVAPSPLYKYAGGKLINYSVREIQLNGTDLTGNTLDYWTITTGQSTAGVVLPESWATEQEYDSNAMVLTVTNTYTPPYNPPSTDYTLTVQWVDANGTALAGSMTSTIPSSGSYNAAAIGGGSGRTFDGYTYNGLAAGSDAISGTMNGNKTVIFTYTGTAVIPPENPPLDETPDTEIPDGTVPLAEAPKTGDELILWILAAAVSGTGLIWLVISGKKRKDDGQNN